MKALARLLSAVALLAAPVAWADSTLVFTHLDQNGQSAGQSTVQVVGGRARFGSSDGQGYSLYNEAAGSFALVAPERQEYTVMDEKTAAQMNQAVDAAMAQARAQMEQALRGKSPEEQARMRAMMQRFGGGPPASAPKIEQRRTSRFDQVGPVKCQIVEVIADGQPAAELCVTPIDQLGISTAEYRTMRSFSDRMEAMSSKTRGGAGPGLTMGAAFEGMVPVRVRRFGPSGQSLDLVLSGVHHDAIDPADLSVPSGFRSRPLEMPRAPGR